MLSNSQLFSSVKMRSKDKMLEAGAFLYNQVGRNAKTKYGLLELSCEILADLPVLADLLSSISRVFEGVKPESQDEGVRVRGATSALVGYLNDMTIFSMTEEEIKLEFMEDIRKITREIWTLRALVRETRLMAQELLDNIKAERIRL